MGRSFCVISKSSIRLKGRPGDPTRIAWLFFLCSMGGTANSPPAHRWPSPHSAQTTKDRVNCHSGGWPCFLVPGAEPDNKTSQAGRLWCGLLIAYLVGLVISILALKCFWTVDVSGWSYWLRNWTDYSLLIIAVHVRSVV